jgi:pimeloyl-ACP methyl ester carboxylesterase
MPSLAINDFQLHYEVRGEGEPLLLLHGGMGIGSDWRYVFPSDPEGYRLIVPDFRGHGRSTTPQEPFTFKANAEDLRLLLDHLQIGRACAIGLSMGAKTLLHLSTAHPARIEAMVLVSATPRFPEPLRAAAAAFTREAFATLPTADLEALKTRHVHGNEQILKLYDMTRSFATSYDDMAFTAQTLAAVRARTLIVHGDRDPLYPVELAVELYRGIGHSTLWIVPNGGHGPIFGERAEWFRAEVLRFLNAPK